MELSQPGPLGPLQSMEMEPSVQVAEPASAPKVSPKGKFLQSQHLELAEAP